MEEEVVGGRWKERGKKLVGGEREERGRRGEGKREEEEEYLKKFKLK